MLMRPGLSKDVIEFILCCLSKAKMVRARGDGGLQGNKAL